MSCFDAYLIPVRPDRLDAYRAFSARVAAIYLEYGALRVVDGLLDPSTGDGTEFHAEEARPAYDGTALRDFPAAAALREGERAILSWTEWPDRATRDAALPRILADPRIQPGPGEETVFDGARLVAGAFDTLLDLAPRP